MGALDDPAARFGLDMTLGPGFLAAALQMQREAEFFGQAARLVIIEALIEAGMLRALPGRVGGGTGIASRVLHIRLWSLRLAPSITPPRGTPRPSVSSER